MKSFLQIENLTKSFGDRVLFSDVTFGIYEGDKIGLIAKNGSGKTTLLRIIAGEESYDSGSLVFRNDLRVGYLKQLPRSAALVDERRSGGAVGGVCGIRMAFPRRSRHLPGL